MKQIIIAIFLSILSFSIMSQDQQTRELNKEEMLVAEYNSVFQSLTIYDAERSACYGKGSINAETHTQGSLAPNNRLIDECIFAMSKQPYMTEAIKQISSFNDKFRTFYFNSKDEDIEYIYYYGYCHKQTYRTTVSGMLSLPLTILKQSCDPKIPSYEEVKSKTASLEKELNMAQIICLKFYDPKYKNCDGKDLENYIERNMQYRSHREFVRFPNIMIITKKTRK